MNRIAILILVLLVTALAILLFHRFDTGPATVVDPSEFHRQPEAALQTADTLLQQARDGVAAAEQARDMLNTIIDSGTDPVSTMQARRHLVILEQLLGNNEAASDVLLDAIQAHPGSVETPRLLFDLGLLFAGPLDRPGEAREIFKRVVDLYPNHALTPEATIRLARIRTSINSPDLPGQASDLREFIMSNPGHPLADEALRLSGGMTNTQETDHE